MVLAALAVACTTPVSEPDQSDAIVLGMGTTDGSCGTTLCCANCPAIPVLRVIDGDTFVTTGNQSVRIFGVDTPEKGEKCYQEATERLRELAGDQVRVELGQGPRIATDGCSTTSTPWTGGALTNCW